MATAGDRGPRGRVTKSIGLALLGVLLTSGCVTHHVAATYPPLPPAEHEMCDDFARGEVRRLGESVPGAFLRGALIGLVLDTTRVAGALHGQYGAGGEPFSLLTEPGGSPPASSGSGPQSPSLALPWTLLGAPQLARDARRTNEEVYEQAMQTCMAPIRLARELGPRHAQVATSLELLANCYAWQRRYTHAEPLRRQALAIWEAVFGPDDPRVARALEEHATLLRELHRGAEADALSARAAGIRARRGSPEPGVPARATTERVEVVRCDSSASAVLFVLCRSARPDPAAAGAP